MFAIEIALLVIAYTLIIITIFLELLCYKRKLESLETIAFTISLLFLIVALTISPFWQESFPSDNTNVLTLFAMVLVGLCTPLNIFEERQIQVKPFWKKLLIILSTILFILVLVGYFIGVLDFVQYAVGLFLGISVMLSMILERRTKPQKRIAHREKIDRKFAIAFIVFVPLNLILTYSFTPNIFIQIIKLTIPSIFILLAASKLLDDLQRLSLFNSKLEPKEQHFKNYSLTEREKEVAIVLVQGTTYKQISEELHISLPTVKTHASNIYRKCGVKSRAELTTLLIN